jgi:hypothetical protein
MAEKEFVLAPRVYPPAPPFPSNAVPTPGLHPGLNAHSYRDGKWTNYICTVEDFGGVIVYRAKDELGDATAGKPIRTRAMKFRMPDGNEKWWLSVPRILLEKLSQMSYPQPTDFKGPEKRKPMDGLPETEIAALQALDGLRALLQCLERDKKLCEEGRYIPFGDVPEILRADVKRQRLTVMSLQLQVQDMLPVLESLKGLPEAL